jgi:glycosyltransferase involved in cell wall biosynthesis
MTGNVTYHESGDGSRGDLVVVMTTFNQESFIERAVSSLLTQTYRRFHIIFFDDGSSDQTAEIALQLLTNQSNITWQMYIQNENLGLESHLAFRAPILRGLSCDYICFCNGDDWWVPTRFEAQLTAFEKLPERVSLLFSSICVVNEQAEVIDLQMHGTEAQELVQFDFLDQGPVNPNLSTIYRFSALTPATLNNVAVPDCFECIDYVRTVHCTSDGRLAHFLPEMVGFYTSAVGVSGQESPWRAWVDLQHLNACNEFFYFYPQHAAVIFKRFTKVLMKMGFTAEQLSTHTSDDEPC